MGSSESKESKETTNSGVLNGNEFSASAKVVNHIDLELSRFMMSTSGLPILMMRLLLS